MSRFKRTTGLPIIVAALLFPGLSPAQETPEQKTAPPAKHTPIPVAKLSRKSGVDFEREILPILKRNCLACHNKTKAKANLILETPEDMLKGGDAGPAIAPKRGHSSLLVKVSAHQIEDKVMPPRNNSVQAANLTPEQLGLLKLWIDQGAKASSRVEAPIEWQPLPPGLNPIYAVALTPDGQYAACSRANQIFVYHLPTRQLVTRLTDPQLLKSGPRGKPGAAHRDMVHSLAFSPDGDLLASGSFREAKLWRRAPETRPLDLAGFSRKPAKALAVSPDGRWLAAAGEDPTIQLWDTSRGKTAARLKGHAGTIDSLRFSPDNRFLLSGSSDKTLRVWTVPVGREYARATLASSVNAVTWLAGGKHLASGGEDGLIRIWWLVADGTRGELIGVRDLRGHEGPITALDALTPEGVQLLSGSGDGTVRQWNAETGQAVRQLNHGGPVTAMAVRGDGKRFVSAGLNSIARLWEPEKGTQVAEVRGEKRARELVAELEHTASFSTNEIAYHKSTLQAATNLVAAETARAQKADDAAASATKTFSEKQAVAQKAAEAKLAAEKELADLNTRAKAATDARDTADKAAKQADLAVKEAKAKAGENQAALEKLAAEAATKAKLAADSKAALDKLNAETKDKIKQANDKLSATAKPLADAEAEVKKAEMAKAGADTELQLARKALEKANASVTEAQSAIQKAEAFQAKARADLQAARQAAAAAERPLRALAFSPDGSVFATAGNDRLIHTWSAEDGTPFATLARLESSVHALAFVTTNSLVVAAADRSPTLWNLPADWKLARTLGTGGTGSPLVDRVNALAFSPDGRVLATGGGEPTRDGEIALWDIADGRLARKISGVHSDAVLALDFSFDGQYLASSAADKFARITELATSKVVKSFEGHTHHVLGVGWKRDGRTLITCGADNTVKTWDVLTGDRRQSIGGFTKQVTSITFIGDSNQALATSGDSKVRVVEEGGKEVRTMTGGTDYVFAGAVTADGRIIIAGGQDSVLRVWNGLNGQALAAFEPPKGN